MPGERGLSCPVNSSQNLDSSKAATVGVAQKTSRSSSNSLSKGHRPALLTVGKLPLLTVCHEEESAHSFREQ